MLHKFINDLFEIDDSICKIIKIGFILSLLIFIIGILIFYYYHITFLNYIYHDISFVLLKTGITFAIEFFICGVATNKIMNEIKM